MDYALAEQTKEALEETYKTVVLAYHRLWEIMLLAEEYLDEGEELSTPLLDLQETYINGEKVYRGIIYSLLPRERDFVMLHQIKRVWTYAAMSLFAKIPEKYESVFAYFIIYLPAGFWDVDNRPIRYIINGMRRCKLIPDDNYKHLMYAVQGEIDNENPRVEIYIFDGNRQREQMSNIVKCFSEVKKPAQNT